MTDVRTDAAAPIACRDLVVGYGRRVVLDRVTLAIEPGRWTAVVGANGAGKSTLLRALCGLQPVRAGEVRLDGRPIDAVTPRERARRIAWLAQGATAPDHLTALECVTLGRFAFTGYLGRTDATDRAAIEEALDSVGVTAWQHRRMATLSGGERQRVLLARALAVGAPTLVLDEPTTFLDPPHQEDAARLMRTLARTRGTTVVSAVHDLSLALAADRLVVIGEGGIVGAGTVDAALAGGWLARAFGTALEIVEHDGRRLWKPRLDA
jgi:iron complex transport system ATP-binding protein